MPDDDAAAVAAALGLAPVRAAQVMPGFDATVWRAELADASTVALRLLRAGQRPDAEVRALRLAAAGGHPVPGVLACGPVGARSAVALTWCAGRTIGDLLVAGGDPVRLGRVLGRAQAHLHVPLDASGTVLCHGDFQPFNVLVDDAVDDDTAADPVVTGIVDWANGAVGDPAADLATTVAVLALAPALLPGHDDAVRALSAAWRRGYADVRPLPSADRMRPFLDRAARIQAGTWTARDPAGPVGTLARALSDGTGTMEL